jgi:ribonuclease P protein subunit POP4
MGIQGIVLKDTLKSFELITKQDRILRVLKKNCVFLMQTDHQCFKIYGCNLGFRPVDRVKHKFKYKAASEFVL